MRGKSTTTKWIISLIIALSYSLFLPAQSVDIPLNHNGLQVINTVKIYKKVVKGDPSKRMVPVQKYVDPFFKDFRYATSNNFTQKVLYKKPSAYLRLEAALALQKVQNELKMKGLALLLYDAYRPYSVTEKMWEIVPDERYAANPAKGSGHNRGASVDVTLASLSTGKPLNMPTEYDDFSEKAHHSYHDLEKELIENRALLRMVMEKHGFVALETEWWHYSLPNASKHFELMNLSFRQMKRVACKTYSN